MFFHDYSDNKVASNYSQLVKPACMKSLSDYTAVVTHLLPPFLKDKATQL